MVEKELAGIEYHGLAGSSHECQDAVLHLLQVGYDFQRVRIVSCANFHALIITNSVGDQIAIKSGFASGYGGTGPNCFSFVLGLLDAHKIEIEECRVGKALFERLDNSALTRADLKRINNAKPCRPQRWSDYVREDHFERGQNGTLWRNFRPIIPFAIVDSRIIDLALSFWKNPDDSLLKGYRRLEDILRTKTKLDDHGIKLFSRSFQGDSARLRWKALSESETTGRANLFVGAFLAYRNPRAHREQKPTSEDHLGEFLLLNHLYRLESTATTYRRRARSRVKSTSPMTEPKV